MQVLSAPRVVTDGRLHAPGWVAVSRGRVRAVGPDRPPAGLGREVALSTGVLAPGLVDIQINGGYGVDFVAAGPPDWRAVAGRLPETGTTAFVPTFITAAVPDLAAALAAYRSVAPGLRGAGARSLGVHLEGPFLSARRRGAHRAEHLCDPTPDRVEALIAAGGGALTYMTLAPERAGALDAIGRLRAAGVRVAVGHSDATYEQVRAAVDAGARLVTHLFNAQRPLHHRDAGVPGAALTDERLTCGLIVDLHHVVAPVVALAFRAAPGRLALVTDAVAALGMPPGQYRLGDEVVDVAPGRPPLRPDGTIGGSTLRMDEAVGNAVGCGVGLVPALDAATRVPADAVGRSDLGRLAADGPADVVWLSDELRTQATWIDGRCTFAAGEDMEDFE